MNKEEEDKIIRDREKWFRDNFVWFERQVKKNITQSTGPMTQFHDDLIQIVVEQLNLNGTGVIKKAELINAWPQSISPLDMEMQARDQYNSFDVTFCFKYVIFTASA